MEHSLLPENLNLVPDCLRTVYHLTHSTVVNVCSGARVSVEYGALDYAVYTVCAAMLAGIVLIFAFTVRDITRWV